jgi:hypothetical protein
MASFSPTERSSSERPSAGEAQPSRCVAIPDRIATDWSPKMIEHFNARVAAEGLDAEGRVMDCHTLNLFG